MIKTFQIFRAGTHTAMGGHTVSVSESELQKAADTYNKSGESVPLFLGHPNEEEEKTASVFGRVRRLFVDGIKLFAEAEVSDALNSLVREKRYKHVSASFFTPLNMKNPFIGTWFLRHVGFVNFPAVRNMDALSFCEIDPADWQDVLTAEFSESCDPESLALHKEVLTHRQIHPDLGYEQALNAVLNQRTFNQFYS